MQDQMTTLVTNAYMEGKKVGRSEVVEWIENTDIMIMLSPGKRKEWQTQKKNWGLEDV